MKKNFLKIALIILSAFLLTVLTIVIYFYSTTSKYNLDEKKLINLDRTVEFYGSDGKMVFAESDGESVTDISEIPSHVINAFIAIEDRRFYSHNGIDYKGLVRASLKNLKSFTFKEGGSTITQQLIKNTHLSGEKTLKRKLAEIKLARKLEKKYDKDKIMEIYLNTIYFGENCYGITDASKNYFNKTPSELTINEGAVLASIIKAPTYYSPTTNPEKCLERKNLVLKEMHEQNYITDEEYEKNKNEKITLNKEEKIYDYFYLVKNELSPIIDENPYSYKKIKVFTNFNEKMQEKLVDKIKNTDQKCDKSTILINNKSEIIAYASTIGDIKRQQGSTIKPLLVYAPAIENNVVSSLTPVLDEKTDFGGYSLSNYADKYYGYVSVKDSLAKSMNTIAVKILNYTGIENAKYYLNKTGIQLSDNDNSLCIALGATEYGSTLKDIVSSYSVFQNSGKYKKATTINKITDENDNIIYENNEKSQRVFGSDTAYIVNDMLRECVKTGTAKKLSFLDFPLYAKTGTVGFDNGNTDAYSVSYNKDYVLGVWYGQKSGLMDNSVSGGTFPTSDAYNIWNFIYENKNAPDEFIKDESVNSVAIDSLSYNIDHKLVLADGNAPKRYVMYGLFKDDNVPKIYSDAFSHPRIENPKISVNNKQICIELCLTQLYNAKIFRVENGIKTEIFDTINSKNKDKIFDEKFAENSEIYYEVVPYFSDGKNIYKGETVKTKTIKIPSEEKTIPKEENSNNESWWLDELL